MSKFGLFFFVVLQIVNLELFGLVELSDRSHPYSHGSGCGFAIEMIHDKIWMQILKQKEPELFYSSSKILTDNHNVLNYETAKKIILLMENSPVIAAYARTKIDSSFIPELNVWISP